MIFTINAWLDSNEPSITVMDRQSGEIMLHFEKDELGELLSSGGFCSADFFSNDHHRQTEIIKHMALYRCLLDNHYAC
jgi:hypothetical protein